MAVGHGSLVMGAWTLPGATAFTRMACGPSSVARARFGRTTAALDRAVAEHGRARRIHRIRGHGDQRAGCAGWDQGAGGFLTGVQDAVDIDGEQEIEGPHDR